MNKFKSHFLILIIITFISLLAYYQTIRMYFLIDDFALIYKLQHINTFSGFWGKGIIGEGPYRHIIDQFILFYPLFKTDPQPYFTIGMILFSLAALTVYFFIYALSRNKIVAFASSAIFAAGYIGSDTMFGITNSWQTCRGIIMALVTFWLYLQFMRTKSRLLYILALTFFYFSLETVYTRAHGLIFAFLFFDLLFYPVVFKIRSIVWFLLRQTPFLIVYAKVFLIGSGYYVQNFGILQILAEVLQQKKYYLLSVPFQNLGNLFIPDTYSKIIDHFIKEYMRTTSDVSLSAFLFGIGFIIISIYLIASNFKKEKTLVKIFIFSISWIISNMILYFTKDTFLILQTSHRYLFYSAFGIAVYWAVGLYLIFNKSSQLKYKVRYLILILVIVTVYLGLGIDYQFQYNQNRSFPAERFYSDFRRYLPQIPQGAVIYMNLANSNQVKSKYNSFFGGMFSEAGNLSIFTEEIDFANDFLFTYKIDDVIKMLKTGQINLNQVYTFYYDEGGLKDTTYKSRNLLSANKIIAINSSEMTVKDFGIDNEGSIEIKPLPNTPSLTPSELSFSLSITTWPFDLFRSKYSSNVVGNFLVNSTERNKIYDYLISRGNFQKTASASAASYWREQEPKFAIDGRLDTAWRGHRGFWNEIFRGRSKNKEYLKIDLKQPLVVSQIRWIVGYKGLRPIVYNIYVSLDNENWKLVKQVNDWSKKGEEVVTVDNFDPVLAKQVKMEVLNTYDNDGPEIREFEVVEDQYAKLDREAINNLESKPFAGVDNQEIYQKALDYIDQEAKMRIYWMSDADSGQDDNQYVELPMVLDGQEHRYTVALPASGTYWRKVTLQGFNFPADISVSKVQLNYKSVKTSFD